MIGFREKIVSRLINTDDIPFSMTLTSYKANNYSINGKNYKLLLVVDGEIEFLYNSSEKKLIKNQFVILNPNKIFGINKLTQNNLILEIDLDYDFVLKSSYNPISFLVNLDGTENEKENEKIVYLVKKLFYYYTTDLGVSAQKCILVLTDMVDILYTYFLGESNEKNQINNLISTKLIEIMEKIFQNRDFDYKLGEIADELNLKASNISKLFKPIFGYGFSECHRMARINKSIELVYSTEYSILEIANIVGFLNSKSLNKNFKEYVGVPPNRYRRQIQELDDNFKYNSISSILESESISEIYKYYENTDIFSKKPVNVEYTNTFDVNVNSEPLIYESVVDKIIDISIFEDNWMEYMSEISTNLRYKNMKINLFFDDSGMYLIKDINKKEHLDPYRRERITHWVESLGIYCRIGIEIPKECVDGIYLYKYENQDVENAYSILEEFFEHLKLLIPSSDLKNWSFELDMPWVWMISRNHKNYRKYKSIYRCIYKLVARNFQESEIGVYLGDIDVVKSKHYLSNIEDIIIDEFKPNFFSFDILDERLFNKNITAANTRIKNLEYIKKVMEFIEELEKKYSFKSEKYVSRMLIYYEWNSIPKIYWESICALNLINRFLVAQKEQILIASIYYYDERYKDKKTLYDNLDKYIQKKSLSNPIGTKNTTYYLSEILSSMGRKCIYSGDGLIATYIDENKYNFLIYQDLEMCKDYVVEKDKIKKEIFLNKKYKINIKGLNGKYRIVTKILHSRENTFLYEWKKMGAPEHIGKDDKEYLQMKTIPERHVEIVQIYGDFEKSIELDIFEIAHIEINKIL